MVDHLVVIKDLPKTKGGHTIALDPGTVAMLRDLQVRQAELKLMLGAGYHDGGWIFCRPDGTPMTSAPKRALAQGRVRHVGEAVAMVVAQTRAQGTSLVLVTHSEAATAEADRVLHLRGDGIAPH